MITQGPYAFAPIFELRVLQWQNLYNVFAKDISFAPTLRVIVPKGESEDYILSVAKEKLEDLGRRELVRWIFAHLDTIADSKEPYSEKDS